MKKYKDIRKIASASLAGALILASHAAPAMENEGRPLMDARQMHTEVERVLGKFQRNMEAYYQRTKKSNRTQDLKTQMHGEVERVLGKFQRNMEAYYQRTRTKRGSTFSPPKDLAASELRLLLPIPLSSEAERIAVGVISEEKKDRVKDTIGELSIFPFSKKAAEEEPKRQEEQKRAEIAARQKEIAQKQADREASAKPVAYKSQGQVTNKATNSPRSALRKINVLGDTPLSQIRATDRSAEVKGIIDQLNNLTSPLTQLEIGELSDLTFAKLNEFKGASFLYDNMKTKLNQALNRVTSFDDAKAILAGNVKSPKVLAKTLFLTEEEVEERDAAIGTRKQETAAKMSQDLINNTTTRVMKESGIQGWLANQSEADVKNTVAKLYNKEIANLTMGNDFLQPLIVLLKGAKDPEDVKSRLTQFEEANPVFKKAVEQREEIARKTVDMEARANTVKMEFSPMISQENSKLINIGGWNAPSLLKFKDGKNSGEAAEFEEIKKSSRTGFVFVPFGSGTTMLQMNMKIFSLGIQKKFSLRAPQESKPPSPRGVTNPQPLQEDTYYKVTVGQSSADELQKFKDRLSEGQYELWSLPGDARGRLFFAISRDPSQAVMSLTLNKGDSRLQGIVYEGIDMAKFLMSGQKGLFQGGAAGIIRGAKSNSNLGDLS